MGQKPSVKRQRIKPAEALANATAEATQESFKRYFGRQHNATQPEPICHRNPLTDMAALGNLPAVELLLERTSLDIQQHSESGETALHIASRQGDTGMMELLLEAGANANAKDGSGFVPLHHALSCDLQLAQALFQARGCPHRVAASTSVLVRLLLQRGADVNERSWDGLSAFHFSLHIGKPTEAVELVLLSNDDVRPDTVAITGETPLHDAVACGSVVLVDAILKTLYSSWTGRPSMSRSRYFKQLLEDQRFRTSGAADTNATFPSRERKNGVAWSPGKIANETTVFPSTFQAVLKLIRQDRLDSDRPDAASSRRVDQQDGSARRGQIVAPYRSHLDGQCVDPLDQISHSGKTPMGCCTGTGPEDRKIAQMLLTTSARLFFHDLAL